MTELLVIKGVAWSSLVRYEIRFGTTTVKILQELGLQPHLQKSSSVRTEYSQRAALATKT